MACLVQCSALKVIFNYRISGTSSNVRYDLIRNFVSMLENLLLFYHCLEKVYITVTTFLFSFGLYCAMEILKQTGSKET